MRSPWDLLTYRTALAVMVLLAALSVAACSGGEADAERPVVILAAASTRPAMEQVATLLRERHNIAVTLSTGGSNALAQQIIAGAPADIYLAASEPWADEVTGRGRVAERVTLLSNDLVLVTPRSNPANVQHPHDLRREKVRRIALAGEHVPAGAYAEQALRSHGLDADLAEAGRIVRGHNVRFALAYVERGEAEAGVVYATDAAAADVELVFTFDPTDHEPIAYPLALLERGARHGAARRAYALLQSPEAQAIFERHGFRRMTNGETRMTNQRSNSNSSNTVAD